MSEFKCAACGQADYCNCICLGWMPIVHSGGKVTHVSTANFPKCNRCGQTICLGQCSNPYCELAHVRAELADAYAEMRKQRPAITAVYDRAVWDKAEEAGR